MSEGVHGARSHRDPPRNVKPIPQRPVYRGCVLSRNTVNPLGYFRRVVPREKEKQM